ncbi:MAG TPA: ATP-binding protein [Opitutaceae bacterium]|nr:ATP-binding protein [Opitutaceae bacterium]
MDIRGKATKSPTASAKPGRKKGKPRGQVSGRREAEKALRASRRALLAAERKYRGFFENAVEGVYQSTVEGRYLDVNPALARLYGYASPAEMMASISNIARDVYVQPDMRQRFQGMIEADGEVRDLEYQVRRRDGRILWISENARVLRNRTGKVLYYEGTIRDVTALKVAEAEALSLERQLRQAQKMEAIGTFASGIAHDFNNMNAAICGFTELALESAPEGSQSQKFMRDVLAVSHRAADLVRQILLFSRQTQPARKTIRLWLVVEEVTRLLCATLPPNIEIIKESLVADDRSVADPGQVHQVLLNLCSNGIHAMHERGGRLTVRLEDAATGPGGAPAQERRLKLSIGDTGHGIPDEVRERIFEPFFTTKPAGRGSGLGLSVVHGIVKNHGGEIQVSSRVGAGTTVTVLLPAGAG